MLKMELALLRQCIDVRMNNLEVHVLKSENRLLHLEMWRMKGASMEEKAEFFNRSNE